MSIQVFEPLELIPADEVPSTGVLRAGISQPPNPPDRGHSDLFPNDDYRNFHGVLGCYMGADPRDGHPLYLTMQGLYAAYYAFAGLERENDFRRTEATSRGMMATMLQGHIGRCIAQGYNNLRGDARPLKAMELITGYIEKQEVASSADYNQELDYHTTKLSLLDRGDEEPTPSEINGIPVISSRDIALALGQVPESPEVERERRKEYTETQISIVRKRLVRLRFEYMSAMAIRQLLQEAVS